MAFDHVGSVAHIVSDTADVFNGGFVIGCEPVPQTVLNPAAIHRLFSNLFFAIGQCRLPNEWRIMWRVLPMVIDPFHRDGFKNYVAGVGFALTDVKFVCLETEI